MKKIISLIVIVLAVVLIIVACNSGDDEEKDTSPTSDTTVEQEADEPEMTIAQENAYESAKSYIDTMAFSKKGLMKQLTSEYGEGYEKKDARFAIKLLEKNGEVNWKDEAVEAAQSYLDTQSFSKDGLYEQLVSDYGEGFTEKQARYAVDKVYK